MLHFNVVQHYKVIRKQTIITIDIISKMSDYVTSDISSETMEHRLLCSH